jgi:hypothetical protein
MGERKLVRTDLDFPGNSNREKEELGTREKLEPVVTGQVIKKKKTFGQKVSEVFFGDDTRSVGDYILHDILIPAMKSTISDMVGGGIEMLLFGEQRSLSSRGSIYRDKGRSYVPYNRLTRTREPERGSRYLTRTERARHDFANIVIPSRGEAEDVMGHLFDLVDTYGVASVADYYELLGIESAFTDQNYGWTNISSAYTKRVRDGYTIILPRPREIEN